MSGEKRTGEAFGKPGIPPRWTSSSKEAVGTAYAASSRIWFTISHGILNEVYYPTIDRPQIRDLELLITDGRSFVHEEKRDLKAKVEVAPDSLGYHIEGVDSQGRYTLHKEIIADPHQACVLVNVRLETAPEWKGRIKLYALLAPHLEVGGAGNSARRHKLAGRDVLIAWKGRTHLAFGCDTGFSATSCGYVGRSDGWQDLMDDMTMDWQFDSADDGNVALMGEIVLPEDGRFTLAIAFGGGLHAALTTLAQSLSVPFSQHRERFREQWSRVCCKIRELDDESCDKGRLYRLSHKLLLSHEDKTFAGAFIASASIPWGQIKGDEDIGGYHLVWTRDLVHSALGLLAAGDEVTPRRALVYLATSQRQDGGFPQNFWINGRPHWSGVQLDEVAFPVMLAWRLWKAGGLGQFDPYPMVKAAAAYLACMGPITQQERWEETSGYSPSTLAAVIAALVCAADMACSRGEESAARFLEDSADFMEAHLEKWTVTTQGSLVPGIPRHYIRILPAKVHDDSPNEDPNAGRLIIPNRPPGAQYEFPAKEIVDAGFLELVRYGVRKPGDALIEDSLAVVDALLKVDTPFGPCWRRYNHDGYGEQPDGRPYQGWGQGRAWPLLTGERGHYELACGRSPEPYIHAIEGFASKGGMLPEQIWDQADIPRHGMYLGRPAGSAMPLMWAHAEYIDLLRSTADSGIFDRLEIVSERYGNGTGRKDLEVWKRGRHVAKVAPGQVLRIQQSARFRLHWTADEWASVRDNDASDSGVGTYYFDIPIEKRDSLRAPIRFTFFWPEKGQWEGKDYRIDVSGTVV